MVRDILFALGQLGQRPVGINQRQQRMSHRMSPDAEAVVHLGHFIEDTFNFFWSVISSNDEIE